MNDIKGSYKQLSDFSSIILSVLQFTLGVEFTPYSNKKQQLSSKIKISALSITSKALSF